MGDIMESRFKEILDDRGITQAHIARKTGANKSTIHRLYKYGVIPELPLAYKIARELNLYIEDIWYIKEQ
jgi:putative transcriptional regulator